MTFSTLSVYDLNSGYSQLISKKTRDFVGILRIPVPENLGDFDRFQL